MICQQTPRTRLIQPPWHATSGSTPHRLSERSSAYCLCTQNSGCHWMSYVCTSKVDFRATTARCPRMTTSMRTAPRRERDFPHREWQPLCLATRSEPIQLIQRPKTQESTRRPRFQDAKRCKSQRSARDLGGEHDFHKHQNMHEAMRHHPQAKRVISMFQGPEKSMSAPALCKKCKLRPKCNHHSRNQGIASA